MKAEAPVMEPDSWNLVNREGKKEDSEGETGVGEGEEGLVGGLEGGMGAEGGTNEVRGP